jgi:cell wall-associated NlpC family hydrolase
MGLDPRAVIAVARQEGLGGGVGDHGTSFGPFQLHEGGALPSGIPLNRAQAWAESPAGINYALSRIKGVAGGLHGSQAVQAIVSRFERPANIAGEVAGAMRDYGAGGNSPALAVSQLIAGGGNAGGGAAQGGANLRQMMSSYLLQQAQSELGGQQQNNGSGLLALAMARKAMSASASSPSADVSVSPGGLLVKGGHGGSPEDQAAVKLAEHYVGTPYKWGGASPGGFDCSGLLQFVWGKNGVNIPRTTYDQFKAGRPVNPKHLQPGDAVFFKGSDSQGGLPGHVGMYIGNGKFIHAPHTGADVQISPLSGMPGFMGARSFG